MTQPFLKIFVALGLVAAGSLAALPASAVNWRHVAHTMSAPTAAHAPARPTAPTARALGSATVTGPNGHSVSRDETVTRTGRYACAGTGTITGPNGGSATASGWWWG